MLALMVNAPEVHAYFANIDVLAALRHAANRLTASRNSLELIMCPGTLSGNQISYQPLNALIYEVFERNRCSESTRIAFSKSQSLAAT